MPQEQMRASEAMQEQHVDDVIVARAAQDELAQVDASLDAILDDVELTLQRNAEEYVRSFVQQGGQ